VTESNSKTASAGFVARRTMVVLLTALAFAALVTIVWVAREIIVLFAFAILFAYLINPVVRALQGHSLLFRNLKGPHVAEVYAVFLICVGVLLHSIAFGAQHRPLEVLRGIPAAIERVASGEIAADLGANFHWNDAQTERVRTTIRGHHDEISGFFAGAERKGFALAGALVVIPILAIFFLSEGENLADQAIQLVATPRTRENLRALAVELDFTMQRYIRAKVILALLSFCFYSLATLALGYPKPFLLGALAGVLEFIPMAGWMISCFTIVTVGFVTHSHWIWMLGLIAVWRLAMDYGISPRVMGHELELHPVVAIFTMMAGGAVGGIVGIYLSIPLVAALRVIWRHVTTRENVSAATLPRTELQS
jgi:predicted PurR-regulated permease PerM